MGEPAHGMGQLVCSTYPDPTDVATDQLPHSADYNQALRMGFRTKEDAIHFAEKQGQSQSLLCSHLTSF